MTLPCIPILENPLLILLEISIFVIAGYLLSHNIKTFTKAVIVIILIGIVGDIIFLHYSGLTSIMVNTLNISAFMSLGFTIRIFKNEKPFIQHNKRK